ncbi:MAG: chitobiase/beta-hexosaminidase C-terminal domain-containing protein [Muribaculum sp.]|nr:chitobiase/beta-hexosaminidase C-terminal domain-containing protein [Muribaculum sp.]
MSDYLQKTKDYWDNLRDVFSRVANLVEEVIDEIDRQWVFYRKELIKTDYGLEWLKKQPFKDKPYWKNKRIELLKQRNQLNRRIAQNTTICNWLRKNISPNGLRVGKIGGGIFAVVDVALLINSAINDFNKIVSIYNSVPNPCEGDYVKAEKLRSKISHTGIGAGVYYTAQLASDVIQIASLVVGVSAIIPTVGTSLSLVGWSIGIAVANLLACKGYELVFKNRMNEHYREAMSLECLKECGLPGNPDCPEHPSGNNGGNNRNGGAYKSGYQNGKPHIDPSGFVYEAVPSNRIAGVQASCYFEDTYYDMYDDPHKQVVLWDAEKYGQVNPQLTNEEGRYRWDVPQGLWQVKYEKDGYLTAYSDWLPVPPPQLEVNIGIVQNKQPEVTEARAYEEGVEIQFDKFMDLSTLNTDNIYVSANGEKLNGSIRLIDSELADEYADEDDETATRYASRVRFVPEEALSATTGEIRVTVSRNVLSYAGIPMTETFSQVLDVEKEVQVIAADDVKVLYGGEKEITIYALPYDAAVGRTLRIANSSDLITSVDKTEASIDEEGKATVIVKGDLPGRAHLNFSIDDVTVTGECVVDVVTEIINAEAPKSSRASGTAVYRGTKVELTTESKDGVIYFTTDGSCPCDENGTRRKYTVPIIINEDTKILAMTSVGIGDDDISETVEFNYTIKRSDMDFAMDEGWTWISHNFEKPIAASTLAADEKVQRIMSQTQEVIRDPQLGMVGMLQELNASESYKVETSSATGRQRLSEIAWNPATPIALNSGWNWLGYPVSQTMTVDEAFAPTAAENLDVIVGQNGFAQFDGENWVGTLETLSPGLGYMYQSQSPKDIVYNTSIVSTASARYATGISQNSPLVLDIHKYPSIMPVVATIKSVDGMNLNNEDYQVNAFCGTECRGIGRIFNGLVMMNVYGNANDKITFQVTDNNGEVQFANNSSLSFSEQIIGNINDPYAIVINSQSGVSNVTYDGNIKVRIVGDMLIIKGITADNIDLVEVYDTDGQKLIHETNVSESGIRISHLNTGVYIVIVNGNGEYTYHKIALR